MPEIDSFSPKFLKTLFQGLSTVHIRRSALSPFLSACLFVSIPCFAIAAFSPDPFSYWVFGAGATPIGVFSIAGMFLLFFDRERLHTEEHLERKHAMEIVEAKGQGLMLDPVDLVNMVNPAPQQKKISPPNQRKLPPSAGEEEVPNG